MQPSSTQVVVFLDALALMNERLMGMEQNLWGLPEMARVSRALDIRRYDYALVVETYVDAKLKSGISISWLLDINWEKSFWTIETRVTTNRGEYEEVLMRYPSKKASTVEQLIKELDAATAMLIASAETVEWKALQARLKD